ncbi:MAG: N-formylglutamate deformylase [Betaproteobacteria bacterium]|nr:N-formylglutamate deformylase [Betaproteobacteria bacterium]
MSALFELVPGDAAVIVNVPHAGTFLPDDIRAALTPEGREVPDTDWHVDTLFRDLARKRNITFMAATHSRIVTDLNRDPSGASLYPGASNTEICPTSTFHDQPHYLPGRAPGAAEIARRVERYWRPYHARLAAEIERIRARHGHAILLDGHSIVSRAPRFFEGRLPDLNLGTADGASAAPAVAEAAARVLASAGAAAGLTFVHNGRFKGGYITRHYGQPRQNVHALQLETAQCCYMDESRPNDFNAARAAPLASVLAALLDALVALPTSTLGERGQKSDD